MEVNVSTVVHRGLTGTTISVDLPAEVMPKRIGTTVAYFTVQGVECEFVAGPRDLGANVAGEFGIELNEHYRMQNGAIRIGSKVESWTVPADGYQFFNKHMVAVWEGASRSVHTHLYDASTADALALFARFTIAETPDGILMTPGKPDVRIGQRPETLMMDLPVLGLVIVRKRTEAELPRWRGSSVRGGETYCDKKDPAGPTFLLASESAILTAVPERASAESAGGPEMTAQHQRSIDLLSVITARWADAQ
jgi:hypothetical protein